MAEESNKKLVDTQFLKSFYERLPEELDIPTSETEDIDWSKEIPIEEENNG